MLLSSATSTFPFPTPPQAVLPAGGLVYQCAATGNLASSADVNIFTLSLDSGQSLSLLVKPDSQAVGPLSSLQPKLEVLDQAGTSLGSNFASTPGGNAFLQALPVSTAGTYRIQISSIAGNGIYTLQATLNAALEREGLSLEGNDTPAAAQDLDSAFIDLGGNAQRTAVLGSGDNARVALLKADFSQDTNGFTVDNSGGGLWHLSAGHGSESGHTGPQSFYYGQNETSSGGGNYSTGARNSGSLISPSISLPAGQPVTVSFNYLLRTESGNYDVAQLQINYGSGWNTLTSYNRTAESGSWKAAVPVDLSAYGGKSVQLRWFFDTKDAMSNGYEGWYIDDVLVQTAPITSDYYSFSLKAGEVTNLGLKKLGSGIAHLAITDAAGTVLAQGQAGNTSGNLDEFISSFQASAAGRYYVRISAEAGLPYNLLVSRSAVFDCEPNNTTSSAQDLSGSLMAWGSINPGGDTDFYTIRLAAGERIRISTRTPGDGAGDPANSLDPVLDLYDNRGYSLVHNDSGAADGRNASLVYQTSTAAYYIVRVSGANSSSGEYSLQLEWLPPVLATTYAPDLVSECDSGAFTYDNVTRLNNSDAEKTLRFTIGNTVPGATVMLYADGQLVGSAAATSTSTVVATNGTAALTDGVHVFTARQQSTDQNLSDVSAALSVTIDTAAPSAPGSPSLLASSDTGISSSDRITQDNTPSFGIAVSSYYRVYRNGTRISSDYESYSTYTASKQADGTWEYALAAMDVAGNESPLGAPTSVTIDTVVPDRPGVLDLQAASDSGVSSSDNITNRTTLGFDVVASPYYRIYRNGTLVSGLYQTGSTCQISGNPDGAHNFTITAVDAAGNTSAMSDALRVTVDTVAARPAIPDLQPGSDSGVSNSDNATYVLTPVFDLSVSEAGMLYLSLDGGAAVATSRVKAAGVSSMNIGELFDCRVSQVYGTGQGATGVVAVDVNLDGKLDLVSADEGEAGGLTIRVGQGDGTFSTAGTLTTAGGVANLLSADLNKDGKPDLITPNRGANSVSIWLGNGDGTFQPRVDASAGTRLHDVVVADVNGDGNPDLVVTSVTDKTVSVLLGRGDGLFQSNRLAVSDVDAAVICAGDFNADGKMDLVTGYSSDGVSFAPGDKLAVLLGGGDGTFASPLVVSAGFSDPQDIGTGDFNADGKLDLLVAETSNDVTVLEGNGDGTFGARCRLMTPDVPSDIFVADLNQDGKLDLATASSAGTVCIVLGSGDGTFNTPMIRTVDPGAERICGGDFDSDGKIDLVTANRMLDGVPHPDSLTVLLDESMPPSQGQHTVNAWLEDLAGNTSPLSIPLNLTLDTTKPTAEIAAVSPNPLTGSVESITISFSEPVAGFDLADLSLTRDGSANLLASAQTLSSTDNRTWTLGNLAGPTKILGSYVLTLTAAGSNIADLAGNALSSGASRSFGNANSAPVLQPISAVTVNEGDLVSFTAQATDGDVPAQRLTFSLVDAPAGASINSSSGLFSWTPGYDQAGQYTFSIRVTDSGSPTLSAAQPVTVTVKDVAQPRLRVAKVTQVPSGFDIQFNMAIDVSKLNLYDGLASKGRAADLTIVGDKIGAVSGTAIWEAAANTLHFVKTGGLLAADTYTVTLFSRADGIMDIAGNLLDGDSDGQPGGNHQVSCEVRPMEARIVSLPDIARGPKQSLILPIRIDNAADVLSISGEFHCNPNLLNASDITLASGLPADWTVVANVLAPGRMRFAAYGTTGLSSSVQNLLTIQASIPADAPYGSAGLLELADVTVGDASGTDLPAQTDAAVQAVAYVGDASGNKSYSGVDAACIANVAIKNVSGFDAYPLIDPTIVGDVTGDGRLGGLDASFVAQKSVGIARTEIPDLPASTPAAPLAAKAVATTNAGTPQRPTHFAQGSVVHPARRRDIIALRVRKSPDSVFSQRAITPEILS